MNANTAHWTTMARALAATCTGRNGTYVCERPEGHTDAHRNTFAHGAETRRARWETPYSEVRFTRVKGR